MLKRYTAIFFILLANIILLAHSARIHHHYDDFAVGNKAHQAQNHDTNHSDKHRHQHQSPIENNHENPLNKQHEHDFPQHCHTVLTDFFIVKSVNKITFSKPIKKDVIIVLAYEEQFDYCVESSIKNNFNKDPFQIRSIFNPSTFCLRGPPVI